MSLPHFFKDDSDSMKYEETIDFFMSWTIRCADKKYESQPGVVHSNSKLILSHLLSDRDKFENYTYFKNVKVWKQSNHVDLWAEFEVGPESKKMALIIETKMYSSIRPGQLEKYRKIATDYYANRTSRELRFVLLRPDYEINIKNKEKERCENLGYKYLNLEELKDRLPQEKTENHLFDEFWYKWYES